MTKLKKEKLYRIRSMHDSREREKGKAEEENLYMDPAYGKK